MSSSYKTIIPEQDIRGKIGELAQQINKHYSDVGNESGVVVIGILTGVFMFLGDLIRYLEFPLLVDFIGLSRYRDADEPGEIEVYYEPQHNLDGKQLLILDCILDKGVTLEFANTYLRRFQPVDIKTCVLLSKETARECDVKVDFAGFTVPDHFVFGYGLDLNGKYRNLPFIAHT
jgi:hypoxanthine phosphoribosyltransferase